MTDLEALAEDLHRMTSRLGADARWRIDLALDVVGCRPDPAGRDPLPRTTWEPLALAIADDLDALFRSGLPGARVADVAAFALVAAAASSRGDEAGALEAIDKARRLSAELGPDDLIGNAWERASWELPRRSRLDDLADALG